MNMTPTNDAPVAVEREAIKEYLIACADECDRQASLYAQSGNVCAVPKLRTEAKAYRTAARMVSEQAHASYRLAALASAPAKCSVCGYPEVDCRARKPWTCFGPGADELASAPAGDGVEQELRDALAEIARLRLATSEGSLRVRADRMWEIADAALARPHSAVAPAGDGEHLTYVRMGSGGRCDWRHLREAVSEAVRGVREVEQDESSDIYNGHRTVPRINYNSLDRIVTAFVDAAIARPRAAVGERVA